MSGKQPQQNKKVRIEWRANVVVGNLKAKRVHKPCQYKCTRPEVHSHTCSAADSRTFSTLTDVMMAAADAKPFKTGFEMKLTMNPRRSKPNRRHNKPTRNVMRST